jgi:hypothetical protein
MLSILHGTEIVLGNKTVHSWLIQALCGMRLYSIGLTNPGRLVKRSSKLCKTYIVEELITEKRLHDHRSYLAFR